MPHVAFRDFDSDEFVLHEVADLSESHPTYLEGEYPLNDADRLVCFEGVTPDELLRLGGWAESQFEEDTVAFTGISPELVPARTVQGIAGVHAYQRARTGADHGEWDDVQTPRDLPNNDS